MKRPRKPKKPTKTRTKEVMVLNLDYHDPLKPLSLQDMIDAAAQQGIDPKLVLLDLTADIDTYDFSVDVDDITVSLRAKLRATVETLDPLYDSKLEAYEDLMVQYEKDRKAYNQSRDARKREAKRKRIAELEAEKARLEAEL